MSYLLLGLAIYFVLVAMFVALCVSASSGDEILERYFANPRRPRPDREERDRLVG